MGPHSHAPMCELWPRHGHGRVEDDEDDADSDGAVAESITVEAFESFDDLVSEAEAVLDDVELNRAPKTQAEVVGENERRQTVSRKRGRKKISFV